MKVHTPHLGQPEVGTDINEALPPTERSCKGLGGAQA